MISLFLNGQEKEISEGACLSEALAVWDYSEPHFAIAINQAFVPRSEYGETLLKSGDAIEVVAPMQGG